MEILGRINAHGFIPSASYASRYRDTASSTSRAVPPEEVLFRRKNAPVRYEETDFYFAHEGLPADRPLPNSDLLEAIHTYSADFYNSEDYDWGAKDNRSMDETALIAMGILIEEMARESINETGNPVQVKEEVREESQPASLPDRQGSRKRANTGRSNIVHTSGDETENGVRKKKRSKKRHISAKIVSDPDTE